MSSCAGKSIVWTHSESVSILIMPSCMAKSIVWIRFSICFHFDSAWYLLLLQWLSLWLLCLKWIILNYAHNIPQFQYQAYWIPRMLMLQYTEVIGLGAHTYKESTHRNIAFHLLFTCRNKSQTILTKQSKTVSVFFFWILMQYQLPWFRTLLLARTPHTPHI